MCQSRLLLVFALSFVAVCANSADADVRVRGHVRRSGSYVAPHFRSSPDRSFWNNWSTRRNRNPYTGAWGTRVTPPRRSYSYRVAPQRISPPSYSAYSASTYSPSRYSTAAYSASAYSAPRPHVDLYRLAELRATAEAEARARVLSDIWTSLDSSARAADEAKVQAASNSRRAAFEAKQASSIQEARSKYAAEAENRAGQWKARQEEDRRRASAKWHAELSEFKSNLAEMELAAQERDAFDAQERSAAIAASRAKVMATHRDRGTDRARTWARADARASAEKLVRSRRAAE